MADSAAGDITTGAMTGITIGAMTDITTGAMADISVVEDITMSSIQMRRHSFTHRKIIIHEGEDEAIDPVGVVPAVDLAVDEEVEIEKMALTIRNQTIKAVIDITAERRMTTVPTVNHTVRQIQTRLYKLPSSPKASQSSSQIGQG